MDLISALRKKVLDPVKGTFKADDGSRHSICEAFSKKLIVLPSDEETYGMSLSDALKQNLIETRSGKIIDRYSGKNVKISEAIQRGLLNPQRMEIFYADKQWRVTLSEALKHRVIEDDCYINNGTRMSLISAFKKHYINNPLTLKECADFGLLEGNLIHDPLLDKSVTLLQGISSGLLDLNLKSIRDTAEDTYITLGEALEKGIITHDGCFVDTALKQEIPFTEAVKRGHLTTVSQKSIFDIEGIKDQNTGDYISFNAAWSNGRIDKTTGKIVDTKTKAKVRFEDACDKELIQPQLLEMLNRPIGINKGRRELTLLESVLEKRIDPNTGLIIDSTSSTIPIEKAVELQLISAMGAAVLKSLLNITVTTATVTQTIRRYIKVSSSSSATSDETSITFQDALKRGLIDDSTGIFTHMETGKEFPLDEAISLGILKLGSSSTPQMKHIKRVVDRQSPEIVVPRKSSTITTKKERMIKRGSDETDGNGYKHIPIAVMSVKTATLKAAIDDNSFDATKGTYRIRDRTISFKECLRLNYIDGSSAIFITEDSKKMSLQKAIDKKILDDNGWYKHGRKTMNIKQAIAAGRIKHAKADSDIMEVASNISYRKSSRTFEIGPSLTPSDLLQALKEGQIRPTDILVTHPNKNESLNITEAIQAGIINASTGKYKLMSGKSISIIEAFTQGYINIMGAPGVEPRRRSTAEVEQTRTIRDGRIHARIVQSGSTTTRIQSFTVTTSSGEELSLDEALQRELISQETADAHREKVNTDSKVDSVSVLIVDPATGQEITSEEAISRGIVTEVEVAEFISMNDDSSTTTTTTSTKSTERRATYLPRRDSTSSSSSSTSSLSDDSAFRTELTIDIDTEPGSTRRRRSKTICLKSGYVLTGLNQIRHLKTGKTMSIFEAELLGIVTSVTENRADAVRIFLNEAISRGLIDYKKGTLTNPIDRKEIKISEAVRMGILITDFQEQNESIYFDIDAPTLSFNEALIHCFNCEDKKFFRKSTSKNYTLNEAIKTRWINGRDVIFDVTSNSHQTVQEAVKKGMLDGNSCDYKVASKKIPILDAAKQGLVAVLPEKVPEIEYSEVTYTLKEAVESSIYSSETCRFNKWTLNQALKSGLIDYRSAEIKNNVTGLSYNLLEGIEEKIIDGSNCTFLDMKKQKHLTLNEAYKSDLLMDIERDTSSPFESISLWEALDNGQLSAETGLFYSIHEEKKNLTLEEAIFRKYIDKKSAYVKDTWKQQYTSLSEATKKRIIRDGHIMNTTTGKYLTVREAIDMDILIREIRCISLIEALDFGMYQPHSGKIKVPGCDREMTLSESIDIKLIDATCTITKSRKSNRYVNTYDAIKMGDIDGLTGMYGSMNLLEARSKGFLLSYDAMQAVQEKFRQASMNCDNLNKWLEKIERQIVSQDVLHEDVDGLKDQINIMRKLKNEVDDHNRPVNNTLDIITELAETGSDVLSPAEINQLQNEGKRLKERYDFVADNLDKLLKRELSALEELAKFRSEMTSFRTWMDRAYHNLEDKERQLANLNKLQSHGDDIKNFVSDIMTHGADLKFLTISGQKFVDLTKEYVNSLNEFKVKFRSSHLKQGESEVSEEVTHVSTAYHELLVRANRLADKFSSVGNKSKDYNDAVDRAKKWLKETEPKVSKICSEPIGAEPRVVEDQLNRSKTLNNEIIANEKLIDDAKQAASYLLNSLDDSSMSPQEKRQIEQTPVELRERYFTIREAMGNRCSDLDSALLQSQGIQDALSNIGGWIDGTEGQLRGIMKPASLIRDRLDEQIRQVKVLQAEIDGHETTISKMYQSAQEFVVSAKNVRESKKIEAKVKEVQKKFESLLATVDQRSRFLVEVSDSLDSFTTSVEKFDEWYLETIDILESREFLQGDSDTLESKVDEIARRKDQKRAEFDTMIKNGKALVSKKDVTDTGSMKETIKELEEKWKELTNILGERQNQNRARKQSLNAYEALRDQVCTWLTKMEHKLEKLEPVGLDIDVIKKQVEELKPLSQEHTSYVKIIDKINEIGLQYDAILRGTVDSGSGGNRRQSMSPRKPSLTPSSLGSRRSSAIPNKFGVQPRRESQIPTFQEQSPIQSQLTDINNRYDMIGMRLGDRDADLSKTRDELKVHYDNIKQILSFLEKQEKNFPRDSVPSDKKESDKQLKLVKNILDQLYENQPLLDETRVSIKDLLRKRPSAPGANILDEKLTTIIGRWKDIQDKCKDRINTLDDLRNFHDIYENLSNWLNSKGRMLNVLGPITSDPRLVQNQMSQIAVIREEFNEKVPQKDRFNEIGDVLVEMSTNTTDSRRIEEKVTSINKKWDDLIAQLEDKENSLDALSGPTRDFMNLTNKLQDNLSKVSDELDDLIGNKADAPQKMKILEDIIKEFDNQRPLMVEVFSVGNHLQSALTDPASRSDIKSKLAQVERQFNNCRKKLDNAMAELENAAKEGKEFDESCRSIQNTLGEFEELLSAKLEVSADKDILKRQIKEFEPLYQEVMSKEHEVIMLLNRGRDIASRAKNPKGQQKVLDTIENQWSKVKKTAQINQKRLNGAMEHCKKYVGYQDKFLPWLEKAERTLEQIKPLSFVRPQLQKQEKELQTFRNDVHRHSSEYEGTSSNGLTFVDFCDVDKAVVTDELVVMKERWDGLNAFIVERAQVLSDIMVKLSEFNDDVRDLGNSIQRTEDKLNNMDDSRKDAKALDNINGLIDDTEDLIKALQKAQDEGDDLIAEANNLGSDASNIGDTINQLNDRLGGLRDKLEHKAADLKNAGDAVTEFNDKIKELNHLLSNLDDEFSKFGPIGRDLKVLHSQMDEVNSFMDKIKAKEEDVEEATRIAEEIASQGFGPSSRELKDTIANMNKQLDKLNSKSHKRQKDINTTIDKVTQFYDIYDTVMGDIDDVLREEKSFGAIGGDIDAIKAQQEDFKKFQRNTVESVDKEVQKTNRNGQGLIQSAASGVNTSKIEGDLEKMNDKWNNLKQDCADRERKLDQGLLQSGQFQEAVDGLLSFMDEMDSMIANQKPPSSDYKVIRAQVQEQKFVAKLLGDREGAVKSLVKMGKEIAATADPSEKRRIEDEVKNLQDKFNDLNKRSSDRMALLEEAMLIAKEYSDKIEPLEKWLVKTEVAIKNMETVPTEEDQIQRRIKDHDKLHDDIIGMQPSFDDVADVATALMQVVGDDDAQTLADKIEDLTNRYGILVNNSDNIHQLLRDSMAGLRTLVLAYEDLLGWMESVEKKLEKYKVLSVFTEKLVTQMEELHNVTEEIVKKQSKIDEVLHHGNELMKNIANEEALQLKDKLDSIQRKYNDLATKAADLLRNAQEMLPLVQNFHQSHSRLSEWMTGVEGIFQSLDTCNLEDQEMEIKRLEQDIIDNRPLLENINISGPQLCQMSPGDGARTIEELVTRDNRRYDAICEQIQRRGERISLSKARSNEIVADIDELLDWFREVENQIGEADPPSSEPNVIRVQLKEHKALNDDISSQKGRVRDVLSNAKKVLRESAQTRETEQVKEKMDDLKETMESVIKLSNTRLGILEQALPLSEHFYETHNELSEWLDEIERESMNQLMPGLRPDQIAKQQEINRSLVQSVQDHKPVLDRLNKTGGALLRLIIEDDAYRVQDIIETDNQRYNALKVGLREHQQALEDAMQECSQFTDKLDGMLNALANTAEQVNNAEPISAHPEKIKEQIDDNNAIMDDLAKKEAALDAVKKAANDIIQKAPNKNDPAIKDIKKKLDKLNTLWNQVQKATKERSDSLEDALALAEKFWDELQQVLAHLKKIQDTLNNQELPAVDPKGIEEQKAELKTIKRDIEGTKPGFDKCRQTGQKLIGAVGDQEKPELKRHIEDLDSAWQNITALYAKREQNLIDAMSKAMEFYETLQDILDFLKKAEKKFENLGPIGTDIEQVKKQISQLRDFKDDVDPFMIKVEALNRRASELTEKATFEQAQGIKEPLSKVNRRWEDINRGITNRQRELEQALLRLGQFQHALKELLIWISRTDSTLDTLKPVFGDPQVIEVELAKLKVMINDIQAHQSSVDTLNDAGRQIIESEKGSREASQTQNKLNELNTKWNELLAKAEDRQRELEDALREAQAFNQEIQDMLLWINDVDSALSSSKPVGGLPETAKDQLDRFMEVFRELEETSPKVEALLHRGNDHLKKSLEGKAANLGNNMKTLKNRWDNIISRANDKKIKLEIALKEATEFHDALQAFINWLTQAEKTLSNLKPVSRVLESIRVQIEDHKDFQNEVSSQRETMLSLDKKGTHLKYFSQKQDVILIKNLLVSVQHRWEKVVSKSAERTRALDYGYKEAKEFQDSWEFLCGWLDEAVERIGETSTQNKNDPDKIKREIAKHKEFQKELGSKQPLYDSTMKSGKQLKDKAPKTDEPVLKEMLTELKSKWLNACNLSVEKQRKLEESLLFSGQFKDALKALMDWLKQMEVSLDAKTPVHGDLDTVIGLVEKHKNFEEDLNARTDQVESIKRTAESLLETADRDDAVKIKEQVTELTTKWENVWSLSKTKTKRLEVALKQAEELHRNVNMLLEWLSDAELKLRFSGPLPEDEDEIRKQLDDHEKFLMELKDKEKDKNYTLELAEEILKKAHPDAVTVIKHWITIIQSRWDEVSSWALQRRDKLEDHLKELKDLLSLLDELMQWLIGKEDNLTYLEQEPLPDDLDVIRNLIDEHQKFMDGLSTRQPEIDSACKPMRPKSTAASSRRPSKMNRIPGHDSPDHDPSRKSSRVSPETRGTPDRRTPRFSDRKGSRASVSQDHGIKNPRAKALWDKWRHVWMMAWERDRRLKDKLSYLQELEKVKNFDWEEWRKRFLKHNSNKKSRVTDLFRKLDQDVDGYLARDHFVEGILNNKFPSSRLEMNAVADKFDHGDGMIDWREFIAALRPDWEDRGPLTDTERIDDEINRQVAQCSCRQKFKVFQVGEGKYRFGDSQKLRLVRILRSTVMVRVGGGWCALDEFLVKNDPCRAKGRTNVELREQFTLASGVSQSMTPFKTRANASPNSSVSGQSGSRTSQSYSTGPITKIKEKSQRSVPMSSRSSFDVGGHGEEMMSFRRSSGAPGSRSGSRPQSRTGSNLSLNSDDSPRGGSVRRSSSMRSGASGGTGVGRPSLRSTPVAFGSSTPRKSSINTFTNGRTSSNSSVDRTPISRRSRTPSSTSIPVSTNLRNRTPSGTAQIQRSGSGIAASDAGSRRTSRTTTSYGADGSRLASTTTTNYGASSSTSSSAKQQQQQQQELSRNW